MNPKRLRRLAAIIAVAPPGVVVLSLVIDFLLELINVSLYDYGSVALDSFLAWPVAVLVALCVLVLSFRVRGPGDAEAKPRFIPHWIKNGGMGILTLILLSVALELLYRWFRLGDGWGTVFSPCFTVLGWFGITGEGTIGCLLFWPVPLLLLAFGLGVGFGVGLAAFARQKSMNSSAGFVPLPLLVAALMAIVIAGAGGILIYTREQGSSAVSENIPIEVEQPIETTALTVPVPAVVESSPPVSDSLPTQGGQAGWNTYRHPTYGFSVQYPPTLSAGTVAANSALGTYDNPVGGIFVGPLVFVVLDRPEIKKKALAYLEGFKRQINEFAANGPPSCTPDMICYTSPPCLLEQLTPTIEFFRCEGEGGRATYGYINGPAYDIFVDGHSEDQGELTVEQTKAVLSTITF